MNERLTLSKFNMPSYVNYTKCKTQENSIIKCTIVNIAILIYITHKKRAI